jgi:hypothetical protein
MAGFARNVICLARRFVGVLVGGRLLLTKSGRELVADADDRNSSKPGVCRGLGEMPARSRQAVAHRAWRREPGVWS